MYSFQNMINSIDYIENNLTHKLCIPDIATVACYSQFHYQRLFQMLTGYTIGEYIRNRRMTLASKELFASDIKVIDLALKYQYDSPEAFSRAFKKLYNLTPREVKKGDVSLRSYPRLSIQIQMNGAIPLDYTIIDKEAFKLIGFKNTFSATEIMEGKEYGRFIRDLEKESKFDKLLDSQCSDLKIAAGKYRSDDLTKYDAIVGTFLSSDEYLKNYDILDIAATKWTVFKGKGPVKDTLFKLWERIFIEWFPQTKFQHSGLIELELFPKGDTGSDTYEYEIWIPIQRI